MTDLVKNKIKIFPLILLYMCIGKYKETYDSILGVKRGEPQNVKIYLRNIRLD